MVVSCALPVNSSTQNTFASVYILQSDKWVLWYQTENVDHTLTPHYTKTFLFEVDDKAVTDESSLKFCINSMTTGTVLGHVVTDINTIQLATHSRLVSPLRDDQGRIISSIQYPPSTHFLFRPYQHPTLSPTLPLNLYPPPISLTS